RWAHDGDEIAFADLQINPPQHPGAPGADGIGFFQASHANHLCSLKTENRKPKTRAPRRSLAEPIVASTPPISCQRAGGGRRWRVPQVAPVTSRPSPVSSHSYLSAIIGSTRVARRAGM